MNTKIETVQIENEMYSTRLKSIENPPSRLYAIGNLKLLNTNCITVVGSRRCSDYGIKMARKFSRELAMRGITVVSGLAMRNRYNSSFWSDEGDGENYCGFG